MYDEPGAKPFLRSTIDRKLGGVAGGLGHYLNVDANALRLLWLFAVPLTGGLALLAYLGLWLLLPEGDTGWAEPSMWATHGHGGRTLGVMLIGLGVLFGLAKLHLFAWLHFGHLLLPMALIALGVFLVARQRRHAL